MNTDQTAHLRSASRLQIFGKRYDVHYNVVYIVTQL